MIDMNIHEVIAALAEPYVWFVGLIFFVCMCIIFTDCTTVYVGEDYGEICGSRAEGAEGAGVIESNRGGEQEAGMYDVCFDLSNWNALMWSVLPTRLTRREL